MDPCIVVWISRKYQQDATLYLVGSFYWFKVICVSTHQYACDSHQRHSDFEARYKNVKANKKRNNGWSSHPALPMYLMHMARFLPVSAVARGRAGRPDHEQQHCYHHAPTVKPEVATADVELLTMGVRTLETCWAVHTSKRQVINLRNCCIWFVDLLEMQCLIYL
jgi:hypothetical protein